MQNSTDDGDEHFLQPCGHFSFSSVFRGKTKFFYQLIPYLVGK